MRNSSISLAVLFCLQLFPQFLFADQALYRQCLQDRTSAITTNIVNQCRADEGAASADIPNATAALEAADQTCEAGANRTAAAMALRECEGLQDPNKTVPQQAGNGGKTLTPASVPPSTKPKTKPTSTAKHKNDNDADAAQSAADDDVNSCRSAKSQATKCCNNPLSCSSSLSASDKQSLSDLNNQMQNGPRAGQSISDYCSQMKRMSNSSGNVNNGLASVCASNQSTCTSTCNDLISKYQDLVDSCSNCAASDVYSNTLSTLQSSLSTCRGLQANSNALATQGLSSSSGSGYSQLCAQTAGDGNPGSGAPGGGGDPLAQQQAALANQQNNDPYGCMTNPGSAACQSCQVNPNTPACQAMANAQAPAQGKAGFQDPSKKSATDGSGFDLPDNLAALQTKMNMQTNDSPSQLANQNQIPQVANNSGGQIPGQNGSNGQATLGGGARHGMAAGPGTNTDIMNGFQQPGYSQGSGFEPVNTQRGMGWINTRLASAAGVNGMQGLDLKKFLPKGEPTRSIAGMVTSGQINGKGVDLFLKISNKFEEKCRLGILWECK